VGALFLRSGPASHAGSVPNDATSDVARQAADALKTLSIR
jgi:hypothetical protein